MNLRLLHHVPLSPDVSARIHRQSALNNISKIIGLWLSERAKADFWQNTLPLN